jgi:predicted nucleic acid-binding protein
MIGFLLDTNVVSDLRKIRANSGLIGWVASVDERSLFLSVLTIAELRIGITIQADAKKRRALETWVVSQLIPRFSGQILVFDLDVAQLWGRIEGQARLGAGKLPVIDSQLAATALHHG